MILNKSKQILLTIKNINESEILVDNKNFFLVYKAPKIHSVPGKGPSLVEWLLEKKPELKDIPERETGLINRLDFETQGLVVFAKNNVSYLKFINEQNKSNIIKHYSALVSLNKKSPPGFPALNNNLLDISCPYTIKSYFRAYGLGRKQVRPVEETTDKAYLKKHKITDRLYFTEILDIKKIENSSEIFSLRVCINQGFRHQIRCHLAWLGCSVLNDMVYGTEIPGNNLQTKGLRTEGLRTSGLRTEGSLALRASELQFCDPGTGELLHYKLPELSIKEI